MPELDSLYPGDRLNLGGFPNLRQVVQTGHTNYRGILKFKDLLFYANPKLSHVSLETNDAGSDLFECYRNGKVVSNFTNGEIG